MRNPSQPDTQRDEYMPDAPNAHNTRTPAPVPEGINPRDLSDAARRR